MTFIMHGLCKYHNSIVLDVYTSITEFVKEIVAFTTKPLYKEYDTSTSNLTQSL